MLEMLQKAADVARNLIPPTEGAADTHVRKWRIWIALATFLNAVGLSVHIALACGFAAPFYSGFAQASDITQQIDEVKRQVEDLNNENKQRRIGTLETNILDTRQKQCAAAPGVKYLYTQSLQKMLVEYAELVDKRYPVPDCDSF